MNAATEMYLTERIAELELAREDQGWTQYGSGDNFEFSREYIMLIARLARLFYIKNPLIRRGVETKANYVFSKPITVKAADDAIDSVVQAFLNDEDNQTFYSSHGSRLDRDRALQTDGNLFYALIPHPGTGHVRMRTIPLEEIVEIVTDPQNRRRTLYYKRSWNMQNEDETGNVTVELIERFYRDYRYRNDKRTSYRDIQIVEGQYVKHVMDGLLDWTFGISEIYPALDWAKAYTKFLENWSTIVQAYARFAWQITTSGGKNAVAAIKNRLNTTINGATGEANPAPIAGSTAVHDEKTKLDPIRTAGATTDAEDGRRLLLMVASAFGLPETFFGDVSVGTLATAQSLDRPTQLMLSNRQKRYADIDDDIMDFVLYFAVKATDGPLNPIAKIVQNEYGEDVLLFNDGVDTTLIVSYPPIVEANAKDIIAAIVSGATFDGKTPTIINDKRLLARMVLEILEVPDVNSVVDMLYPPGTDATVQPIQSIVDPSTDPTKDDTQSPKDKALAESMQELRESIDKYVESIAEIGVTA